MGIFLFFFYQATWVETTQSDFRDGWFDSNIYASQQAGGTIEFTSRWDLNNDGYLEIVVANEQYDYSYVYWGSAAGYNAYTQYPVVGAQSAEAGDINNDGYADLVFASPTESNVHVFWGSPAGPNPNSQQIIYLYSWNESCYLADINRDGFLDLAVNSYSSGNGAVFYGSSSGLVTPPGDLFPTSGGGVNNIECADFNMDRNLDLVAVNGANNRCYVYWGSETGFNANHRVELRRPPGMTKGLSVADLDKDGKLDIILTAFGNNAYWSFLYRGIADTFFLWDSLVANNCFGGSTVADLNNDTYLDILYTRGYGLLSQPIIYWGSATGYSYNNCYLLDLLIDASGTGVADFNRDNQLDILVDNYGNPSYSYIFYGPGYILSDSVANVRDNCSRFREAGNVYNRKYYEDYVSSIFDAGLFSAWGIITWGDTLPPGSQVLMSVRSGNTPVPDTTWSIWDSLGNGDDIPAALDSRYLQYRGRLIYQTLVYLPKLYEVRVEYINTGAEEKEAGSNLPICIVAFPNPAKNRVNFSIPANIGMKELCIYNSCGGKIGTAKLESSANGRVLYHWDRKDYLGRTVPAGVYLYRVERGTIQTGKFVLLD